ncbi:hypothetical protein G9P44_000619 [Scheffersomyces stipitis]|nr:hypothetical protein G9P44_000619 [Scheffersomyces stipitis]
MSQGQVDLPPAVAATTATSPTTSNSHRRPAPDSPTIDSESAASPSYTSSTSAASASEPPRKRHRPRSLDLKSGADDSSHVALRIVSPGLPPLNSAEMRSTLKISQRIEQQQRELIASRAGVTRSLSTSASASVPSHIQRTTASVGTSKSATQTQFKTQIKSPQNQKHQNQSTTIRIQTPSQLLSSSANSSHPLSSSPLNEADLANSEVVSANTSINENGSPASETRSTIITVNAQPTAADELDRLSTPSSAKRLKRSNVPSPLSIGSQDSDSLRPAIHSAPIRVSTNTNCKPHSTARPQRGQVPHLHHKHSGPGPIHAPSANIYPPQGQYHYVGGPYQQYYGPPVAKSQFRPFPNTHVTYSSLPPLQSGGSVHPYQVGIPIKRSRPIYPYTTTSAHFPRAVRLAPHPYHNPQHHLMANQRQGPHRSASPPLRSPSSVARSTPSVSSSSLSSINASASATASASSSGSATGPGATGASGTRPKPFSVTDVYHGDLMKTAPLQSQPLSAQRDYFESQGKARMSQQDVDDDRLPVSEDEIREMQEKYKSSEDLHEEEEEEDDDEEDAASRTGPYPAGARVSYHHNPYSYGAPLGYYSQQQQQAQLYYQQQAAAIASARAPVPQLRAPLTNRLDTGVNGEEIFGSINIMNESIFNFRIFNPKSKEAEADDKEVSKGEEPSKGKVSTTGKENEIENDKEKETATESSSSDQKAEGSVSPEGENEDTSGDWLAKEKDKFLRICETSWDKFVNSRKQM